MRHGIGLLLLGGLIVRRVGVGGRFGAELLSDGDLLRPWQLHMLFWELADRWGTVRGDGVHVPLRLTHAVLADLVAARRPTVTKALGELAGRSAVAWTGADWLLTGAPPAELNAVGPVAIPPGPRERDL